MNDDARSAGGATQPPLQGGLPLPGLAALLLLCALTWMISHPYQGIVHDARLYMLQGLARLSTESLARDVFLRFGSQDRYTLFGPLFAATSRILGPEHAAALLTCAFQLALIASAACVARAVMPRALVPLAAAMIVAVPGYYGAERIFVCMESFVTPRMAGEALALFSLAAALGGRKAWSLALIAAAALLHPVMAAAGIAALLCLYVALPHPRLGAGLTVLALLGLLVSAYGMAEGPWGRFDAVWLTLVRNRSPFLFLSYWTLDDWSRLAIAVTTLGIGLVVLPRGRGHRLCAAALLTTVGGLALTLIACDGLHLVLPTQLQPWRWQWLGTLSACIMLPAIVHTAWRAGDMPRTAALLLLSAWIFGVDEFGLGACAAAIGAAAIGGRLGARESRLLLWGGCAMLAMAVVWRVASNLEFTEAHFMDTHIPLWLRRTVSFTGDGGAPMAVIVSAWWLIRRLGTGTGGRIGRGLLVLAAAAACVALLPLSWARWTAREYPPELVARYAPWRELVPAGSDVFWTGSTVATWLLLDRPNYLSTVQTAGMVFSRTAALEMSRRAEALKSLLPPGVFLQWNRAGDGVDLSLQELLGICRLGAVDFLVAAADIGVRPLGQMPVKPGEVSRASAGAPRTLKLYDCRPQARAAAAST